MNSAPKPSPTIATLTFFAMRPVPPLWFAVSVRTGTNRSKDRWLLRLPARQIADDFEMPFRHRLHRKPTAPCEQHHAVEFRIFFERVQCHDGFELGDEAHVHRQPNGILFGSLFIVVVVGRIEGGGIGMSGADDFRDPRYASGI